MQEWKKERCAHEPQELEEVAPDTLIQRKDIKKVEHEASDGMDAYADYECMSRIISKSEYNMLKSIEEIDSQKAIDAYTLQLMEEGVI